LLFNEKGEDFPFTFSQTDASNVLLLKNLTPGDYRIKVSASFQNRILSKESLFSVSPVNIESVNSEANHALLKDMSYASGGLVVFPGSESALVKHLGESSGIKTIEHSYVSFKELGSIALILVLIISLLAIEWLARKYFRYL